MTLPNLIDSRGLQDLGIPRRGAEAIMRQLSIVRIEGYNRNFVRVADIEKAGHVLVSGDDEWREFWVGVYREERLPEGVRV